MLDENPDLVNRPGPHGWSPILCACYSRVQPLEPAHSTFDVARLLLERGADPNDEETPYHVPETYDNAVLKVLLDSGALNRLSLTLMLLRKTDWHDLDGVRLRVDPVIDGCRGAGQGAGGWNRDGPGEGRRPLHHPDGHSRC